MNRIQVPGLNTDVIKRKLGESRERRKKRGSRQGDYEFFTLGDPSNTIRWGFPWSQEAVTDEFYHGGIAAVVYKHYGLPKGTFGKICLRSTYPELNIQCEFCNAMKAFQEQLGGSTAGHRISLRAYTNIIDRNADEGVRWQIMDAPESVFNWMMEKMVHPQWGARLVDPYEGHDIVVARSGGSRPRYKPEFVFHASPLAEDEATVNALCQPRSENNAVGYYDISRLVQRQPSDNQISRLAEDAEKFREALGITSGSVSVPESYPQIGAPPPAPAHQPESAVPAPAPSSPAPVPVAPAPVPATQQVPPAPAPARATGAVAPPPPAASVPPQAPAAPPTTAMSSTPAGAPTGRTCQCGSPFCEGPNGVAVCEKGHVDVNDVLKPYVTLNGSSDPVADFAGTGARPLCFSGFQGGVYLNWDPLVTLRGGIVDCCLECDFEPACKDETERLGTPTPPFKK